jgi:putative Mg2+ transporter-C (MgtC) family protein
MSELLRGALPELQALGTVVVAMALGALIGAEREAADKPAGLRTHMLVAGAAALLSTLGVVAVERFAGEGLAGVVRSDPIRILEAIITGVSFLGAGTIIRRDGRNVEGLTTAASLLFTAGIGVTIALSRYLLALGATALALVTLRLIRRLER